MLFFFLMDLLPFPGGGGGGERKGTMDGNKTKMKLKAVFIFVFAEIIFPLLSEERVNERPDLPWVR